MGDFVKPVLYTDDQLKTQIREMLIFHAGWNSDVVIDNEVNDWLQMFQVQKKAHADMAIGEIIPHKEQCLYYKKSHQDTSLCICEARPKNQLINVQRIRNKGGQNAKS